MQEAMEAAAAPPEPVRRSAATARPRPDCASRRFITQKRPRPGKRDNGHWLHQHRFERIRMDGTWHDCLDSGRKHSPVTSRCLRRRLYGPKRAWNGVNRRAKRNGHDIGRTSDDYSWHGLADHAEDQSGECDRSSVEVNPGPGTRLAWAGATSFKEPVNALKPGSLHYAMVSWRILQEPIARITSQNVSPSLTRDRKGHVDGLCQHGRGAIPILPRLPVPGWRLRGVLRVEPIPGYAPTIARRSGNEGIAA